MLTVRTNTVNLVVLTIVTINVCFGQKIKKDCPFLQQVRLNSWGWCWIIRRLQVPVTTTNKTGIFQFLYTHGILLVFWRIGESGFPANFFSRKRACLLLERANAEGEFLYFPRRLTGFTVARPETSLSSLALFGVLAGSLHLTVNHNEC